MSLGHGFGCLGVRGGGLVELMSEWVMVWYRYSSFGVLHGTFLFFIHAAFWHIVFILAEMH